VLFLSSGIVDWLQALLHWCDNNAVFIVDVSKVFANSSSFRWQTVTNVTKQVFDMLIAKLVLGNTSRLKCLGHLFHKIGVTAL